VDRALEYASLSPQSLIGGPSVYKEIEGANKGEAEDLIQSSIRVLET